MARKPITDMSAWPSLSLEGNLIAPAMIAKIDRREADKQDEADYGVRKGLTVREEISLAFRVGQAHFDAFTRMSSPSAEAARRFTSEFLRETFGFSDLADGPGIVASTSGGRVPVIVVPPQEVLDRKSPTLSIDHRSLSPSIALQDYLNEHDDALWGLVTNGSRLRLMRDNASLTRPAHIEADLEQIFTNEDAASFATLWQIIHRSRFGPAGSPATDCVLERWRETGAREGEAARNRLAGQVEKALRVLGSGFLEANPDLAAQLRSGELSLTTWFNELLRLVYRLIFLMVAEDRALLHPPNARKNAQRLYVEGYSLAVLRAQSVRSASWNRHHDRYEGIKIVFRGLTNGEPALALPALGGLFGAEQLPSLETARLRNSAFMEAVYRLSWLRDSSGIVPVNWRAMETEELGSVYESLLELQPQLNDDGLSLVFASDSSEQMGNQRKTTGSYYTPDSLVQALLDTALDPVLDRTESEAADPTSALLKLSIIDPACGSGHFLLAAARRVATRLARIRAEGTPSLADYRHALRDVARCCIHGVDRNPMAVELTKVALWIETVDPGLPLGFFDAQVRCGDALLGIFDLAVLKEGIPDAAYKPLTGDVGTTALYYRNANRGTKRGQGELDFGVGGGTLPTMRPLVDDYSDLRNLPEDTVDQIGKKARRFRQLRTLGSFVRIRTAADLYVAAFLLPKIGDAPSGPSSRIVPTTDEVWLALEQGKLRKSMFNAPKVAQDTRAFHWPLEFPDIMERGGFDVVLGNPPWEVTQFSEKEYFATRQPEIAALSGAARKDAIEQLEHTDPETFSGYFTAKRTVDSFNMFMRNCGRFDLTARGKINTYALFAELNSCLALDHAGFIVPTGIATDKTTAPFFASLIENERLAQLVDFENRAKLFPAVDSRMKFCLLTLGRGEDTARFAFFLTDPAQLADEERNFALSPNEIAAINPNTRTAPVFRSRADAELTAKIYANAPVLIDERKGPEGNPWGVKFSQGLFNMTSASGLFRTARQLANAGYVREGTDWVHPNPYGQQGKLEFENNDFGGLPLVGGGPPVSRYVPLYEAKMIHQFDHRWASYDEDGENSVELSVAEKQNPNCEPSPRYWVPSKEVDERLAKKDWTRRWLMGWRDITNATNERTVIAAALPKCGVGNNLPLMLFSSDFSRAKLAGLIGNLCSLVHDFAARHKVGGTHLNYFVYQQLPLLPPTFFTEARVAFLTPKIMELTYTSRAMTPFALDLGFDGPPFRYVEERRAHIRADLDAFFARAYGLDRNELRYILDPSEVMGRDYPSETFRVLKQKEIREFDDYRTARLVLAAWDRMEASGDFRSLGV